MKKLIYATMVIASICSCKQKDKIAEEKPKQINTPYSDSLAAHNHYIPVKLAKEMVERYVLYKDSLMSGKQPVRKINLAYCETLNLDIPNAILNSNNVAGMRLYYGIDSFNHIKPIFTAVDKLGGDIYFTGNVKYPSKNPPSVDSVDINAGDIVHSSDTLFRGGKLMFRGKTLFNKQSKN